MIYTLIVDISRFSAEKFTEKIRCGEKYYGAVDEELSESGYSRILPCPELSGSVISHILDTKNEDLRFERFGAYISLFAIIDNLFGKKLRLSRLKNGKPFFENEQIYFNISHHKNIIAVAVSDKSDVGVDIEGKIPAERAARLESRFFFGLGFEQKPLNVNYMYAELSASGCLCFYDFVMDAESNTLFTGVKKAVIKPGCFSESFTSKWTLYEAFVKCSGEGISSLPCLCESLISAYADIKKIIIEEKEYYLSTVSLK